MRKEIAMATYYIGADVHSNNTELAIEQKGRIVARYSVPTTIPAISTVLNSFQGKKIFAMEEGPMAGWLYRHLNEKVDKFIVAEPRRNKLITCEGDRDDRIDSGTLAKRNGALAAKALAAKWSKAAYYIMKRQEAFDLTRVFG
jgi:hypothetical protein